MARFSKLKFLFALKEFTCKSWTFALERYLKIILSVCVLILKLIKNNYVDISPTKNGFFEIYEVKNWYQPHKKSGAGWVGGWMGGW